MSLTCGHCNLIILPKNVSSAIKCSGQCSSFKCENLSDKDASHYKAEERKTCGTRWFCSRCEIPTASLIKSLLRSEFSAFRDEINYPTIRLLYMMDALSEIIPTEVYNRLIEADVDSLKCIILLNNVELQEKAKLNYEEAKLVLEKVADIIVHHKLKSALTIPDWTRLSTGCENIDKICNGGIPSKGITEIFGYSGVGKTQLTLQLSLMVQFTSSAGGFSKGAVYICTEDIFPSKRLHSLATKLPAKFNQPCSNLEDNIFIEHIADYEQLRRLLFVRMPHLLERVPIGLIVIDSIAGVFRSENLSVNYATRSEEIYSIAAKLKEYSRKYNLAAVCINQVTDDPNSGITKPSLGYAWANLVTCRFEISRLSPESKVRVFEVINSPDLPPASCNFLITPEGLTSY